MVLAHLHYVYRAAIRQIILTGQPHLSLTGPIWAYPSGAHWVCYAGPCGHRTVMHFQLKMYQFILIHFHLQNQNFQKCINLKYLKLFVNFQFFLGLMIINQALILEARSFRDIWKQYYYRIASRDTSRYENLLLYLLNANAFLNIGRSQSILPSQVPMSEKN